MRDAACSGRRDPRKAVAATLLAIAGAAMLAPPVLAADAVVETETGLWQLAGVVSILHEPPGPVQWTVDISPNSYRSSYLEAACGILARNGEHGQVRFVDAVMVHAGKGFRRANLGRVDCRSGEIIQP